MLYFGLVYPQTSHYRQMQYIEQNCCSISTVIAYLLFTVTSDGVVTVANCRQHGNCVATGSVVTVLPAVNIGDYNGTVKSPCTMVLSLCTKNVVIVQHDGISFAVYRMFTILSSLFKKNTNSL